MVNQNGHPKPEAPLQIFEDFHYPSCVMQLWICHYSIMTVIRASEKQNYD